MNRSVRRNFDDKLFAKAAALAKGVVAAQRPTINLWLFTTIPFRLKGVFW